MFGGTRCSTQKELIVTFAYFCRAHKEQFEAWRLLSGSNCDLPFDLSDGCARGRVVAIGAGTFRRYLHSNELHSGRWIALRLYQRRRSIGERVSLDWQQYGARQIQRKTLHTDLFSRPTIDPAGRRAGAGVGAQRRPVGGDRCRDRAHSKESAGSI